MGLLNFRSLLIPSILAALLFTIFSVMIVQVSNDYNVPVDGNFTTMFTEVNKTLATSSEFAERMQNSTESGSGFTTQGGEADIARVMSQSIKLPFSQVKTMSSLGNIIAVKLGIPVFVLNTLLSIVLILIAVVFLTILFKPPGGV